VQMSNIADRAPEDAISQFVAEPDDEDDGADGDQTITSSRYRDADELPVQS
jgi:hypothetical protein